MFAKRHRNYFGKTGTIVIMYSFLEIKYANVRDSFVH